MPNINITKIITKVKTLKKGWEHQHDIEKLQVKSISCQWGLIYQEETGPTVWIKPN